MIPISLREIDGKTMSAPETNKIPGMFLFYLLRN